jgi:hypothetical protein
MADGAEDRPYRSSDHCDTVLEFFRWLEVPGHAEKVLRDQCSSCNLALERSQLHCSWCILCGGQGIRELIIGKKSGARLTCLSCLSFCCNDGFGPMLSDHRYYGGHGFVCRTCLLGLLGTQASAEPYLAPVHSATLRPRELEALLKDGQQPRPGNLYLGHCASRVIEVLPAPCLETMGLIRSGYCLNLKYEPR